jgi:hypothetical protein
VNIVTFAPPPRCLELALICFGILSPNLVLSASAPSISSISPSSPTASSSNQTVYVYGSQFQRDANLVSLAVSTLPPTLTASHNRRLGGYVKRTPSHQLRFCGYSLWMTRKH